eukprot:m51a1_g6319 hypothetical protein (170) ;mRNA; r:349578-350284
MAGAETEAAQELRQRYLELAEGVVGECERAFPGVLASFGDAQAARAKCARDCQFHVAKLAEALADHDSAPFVVYAGWCRSLLQLLGVPTPMAQVLEAVKRGAVERMRGSQEARDAAGLYVDRAIAALADSGHVIRDEDGTDVAVMAARFVETVARGMPSGAAERQANHP